MRGKVRLTQCLKTMCGRPCFNWEAESERRVMLAISLETNIWLRDLLQKLYGYPETRLIRFSKLALCSYAGQFVSEPQTDVSGLMLKNGFRRAQNRFGLYNWKFESPMLRTTNHPIGRQDGAGTLRAAGQTQTASGISLSWWLHPEIDVAADWSRVGKAPVPQDRWCVRTGPITFSAS